jgi:nucleoside-diphosphate-sugar epimerase
LATGRLPARAAEPHYVTYVHVRDVVDAIERVLDHPGAVGERYIVAAAALTVGEINAIVRDVTGVRLPLLKIPDWLALLAAHALTWIADRIGRAPPWGMASDQIRMMVAGFRCDGSKAAKELDLQYTPVPIAFEEALRTTPPEAFPASGGEP